MKIKGLKNRNTCSPEPKEKEKRIIINTGAVIIENNRILLVQEAEEPFRGKWNFPLGKIEKDETVIAAVLREVKEETGYDVKLTSFLGVYQNLSSPELNVIIIMFGATPVGGKLDHDKKELLQSKWFSLQEFNSFSNKDLFHPEMRNVVNRALKDSRPLDTYIHF